VGHEVFAAYQRLIALRRSSEALAAAASATRTSRPTRSPTCARTPGERLLCLATRAPGPPIRLPLGAELERSRAARHGRDGGWAVLPGDGPAFSMWRLV
jgi:hypothetical protein